MILENSPSARMQVRSRGQLVAPACCIVCGTSDTEREYLDVGAFIDFHGSVYFCNLCLRQGAETIGMFTPEEVKHLQDQIRSLLTQKEYLEAELDKANEYVDNFKYLLRSATNSGTGTEHPDGEDVSEPNERPTGGEPEVKEPTPFNDPAPVSGPQLRDIKFN